MAPGPVLTGWCSAPIQELPGTAFACTMFHYLADKLSPLLVISDHLELSLTLKLIDYQILKNSPELKNFSVIKKTQNIPLL